MPSNSTPARGWFDDNPRDLRVKLLWLSVFRMVATTLLLGTIALRLLSRPTDLSWEDSLSFLVIGVVYVMTLVYALWLRSGRAGTGVALAQLVGDVALATSLVYLTGGTESPFTFTYLIAVVAGAIVLYQEGALVTAAASSVAYVALAVSIYHGWVRRPSGAGSLSADRVAFDIVSTVLAQVLIAALAGYLSRQLRAAGGRLSERESDLRVLAAFQREILVSMPSGLLTCDPVGRVTFLNRAGLQILGIEERAAVGLSLDVLMPGARKLAHARRETLEAPTPLGLRVLGVTVISLDADGPGALLAVFQDLTALRRMEEELSRADRLAAVGRMAAQLAHEIRNPLAAMRGSAQMLAADPRAAASERLANILIRESDRLSKLVDDFLRFARPPAPSLSRCSLATVVRDTLEVLHADPLVRHSQIETALDEVETRADPDQLRQVLINLLRNALAAAGPQGSVRVSTSPSGTRAQLKVWDSAGSIPPGELMRIFEPFHSRHEGGTGLGLSICFSIVRAHEGHLTVSSSPGAGTEFVVELPRYSEDALAHPGR